MKKLLLTLSFLLLLSYVAKSQCTPVTFPGPEVITPDSTVGVAPVVATHPYSQQINLRIPTDSVISGFVLPIDSAGIVSINGLPTGLSYVSNSPTDFWPGGSYGCVVIQGTVASADTGHYYATVDGIIYFFGQSMSFAYAYHVDVIDSSHVSISKAENQEFNMSECMPNPMNSSTKITYFSSKISDFQLEVYNALGEMVQRKDLQSQMGLNEITIKRENLESGIYFVRLSNGEQGAIRRLIVQ